MRLAVRLSAILAAGAGPLAWGQGPGPAPPKPSLLVVKPGAAPSPLDERAEIGAVKVKVGSGDSVEFLLKQHGIYPDAESLALLYQLNPEVKDLKKLPGDLTVPVAKGSGAEAAIKAGGLIATVYDKPVKEEFVRRAAAATDRAEAFAKLEAGQFSSPQERVEITNLVTKTAEGFDVFRLVVKGKTRPLSPDLVRQLEGEAAVFNDILTRAAKSSDPVPATDKEALQQISKSMTLRRRGLNEVMGSADLPPRWPEVRVKVKTVDAGGVEKGHYQVYAVAEALHGKPEYTSAFDTLSSPTERSLPEAYYFVWAVDPKGPPKNELGRKKVEAVRRNGKDEITVEIVVP